METAVSGLYLLYVFWILTKQQLNNISDYMGMIMVTD